MQPGEKANERVVIAIDGPAGAGKSTVAKSIAKKLGILYLDTGAMYRAFTLYVLEKKIPLDDLQRIKESIDGFRLKITEDSVFLASRDVTLEIRSAEVDEHVSYISSLEFVRKKMVDLQREIGKNKDIVVEGRDIGTVVFPGTRHKFYLDASVQERALRRLRDKKSRNTGKTLVDMVEKINKRDQYDSTRRFSPLKKADDATYIDSTDMSIEEVSAFIISKVND